MCHKASKSALRQQAASWRAEDWRCPRCRTRFWWDLVAWIPWDYLALMALGDFHMGASLIARVPLLRLLRLVSHPSVALISSLRLPRLVSQPSIPRMS